MGTKEWAKEEIKIAMKRENPDGKEGEFDYGCACYESAYKAFESLCGDGHSGFSIKMTQHILNRLIDGMPLTPIEDTDEVWSTIGDGSGLEGEFVNYQCKRMSSLFKYIYKDGTVKYRDIDRTYCIDINNPSASYTNGFIATLIEKMFPITMPYMPSSNARIKVVCEEFLTDAKNGDYDTVGVLYAIRGEEKIEINRYFKEGDVSFDEITKEEYEIRKLSKIEKEQDEN